MTLTLAGVMAFGGAGLLSLKISDAKTQEGITAEKMNVDFAEETNDVMVPEEKMEETETNVVIEAEEKSEETKAPQTTKGISLPEGAKIMEETGNSVKISWDSYQITYHTADSEEETEADMGMERAIGGAIKTIQKCTNQNLIGKNIEISLLENIPQDEDFISSKAGTEYNSAVMTSVTNKKNYGVRYYAVDIDGIKDHSYSICINSITEEVFGYADYYDKDSSDYNKEYDENIPEQVKKEYTQIAKEFVKNSLEHLGTVKDSYAFTTGFMETEHGTRNTFDISCKTEKGDIVAITIDQEEKSVLGFEVNPLWID